MNQTPKAQLSKESNESEGFPFDKLQHADLASCGRLDGRNVMLPLWAQRKVRVGVHIFNNITRHLKTIIHYTSDTLPKIMSGFVASSPVVNPDSLLKSIINPSQAAN